VQRAVSTLYRTALWCLDPEVKPPLVWHWDALEMARLVKDDIVLHEVDQGYPAAEVTALWDPETEAIHVTMGLCLRPLATILMYLLHELAHANEKDQGKDGEKRADEWALSQFRRLARSKRWLDKTGIKLGLKRGAHRLSPDDRVKSKPVRLPTYQLPSVLQRY